MHIDETAPYEAATDEPEAEGAEPGATEDVEVPTPPHPEQRAEALPWERTKPSLDDPEAPARVQAIMASPSYRIADDDPDFLNLADNRGLRLMVDYRKTELALQRLGVEHTIAVFGSSRIPEPAAAARRLAELAHAAEQDPDDEQLARRVAVAARQRELSRYYQVARDLGRLVGAADGGPDGCRIMLVTGGGPGMMEAANRGAFDIGAPSAGLNIDLPREQYPNPYITPELCFRFRYFAMRKLHFLQRARALVAFPGGYGTLDELFETLTLVQTRKVAPMPIVLVGREFWRRAVDFDYLVEVGTIDPEDMQLFWFAETAEEIWQGILKWHELAGTPLVPCP